MSFQRSLAGWSVALFLLGAAPSHARFWFLDLAPIANHGFLDSFEGKEPGPGDEEQIKSLKDLPTGNPFFRSIPFRVLDPVQNPGRSFVVLKGEIPSPIPAGFDHPLRQSNRRGIIFSPRMPLGFDWTGLQGGGI